MPEIVEQPAALRLLRQRLLLLFVAEPRFRFFCYRVQMSSEVRVSAIDDSEELRLLVRAELKRLLREEKDDDDTPRLGVYNAASIAAGTASSMGDGKNVENIYSYAMHVAVTGSPVDVAFALLSLMCTQCATTLFAFAYFDASWLEHDLATAAYPALSGITLGNFYESDAEAYFAKKDSAGVPYVLKVAGAIGCIVMVTLGRGEDKETLWTPFPAASPSYQARKLLSRRDCWRLLPLVLLQCCWALRAVFVPITIVVGVGHALAASRNAQETVLNALAAGYLFDLDSLGYALLVPTHKRDAYEDAPPLLLSWSTRRLEAIEWLIEVYSWGLWTVSLVVSLHIFLATDANAIDYDSGGYIVRVVNEVGVILLVRAALIGIAHAHVAFATRRSDLQQGQSQLVRGRGMQTLWLASRYVCIAFVAVLFGWLAYLAYFHVLDDSLGFTPVEGQWCLKDCLQTFPNEINATRCYGKDVVCSEPEGYWYDAVYDDDSNSAALDTYDSTGSDSAGSDSTSTGSYLG